MATGLLDAPAVEEPSAPAPKPLLDTPPLEEPAKTAVPAAKPLLDTPAIEEPKPTTVAAKPLLSTPALEEPTAPPPPPPPPGVKPATTKAPEPIPWWAQPLRMGAEAIGGKEFATSVGLEPPDVAAQVEAQKQTDAAAAQQKAQQQQAAVPGALSALTTPDDTTAQGKEVQINGQTYRYQYDDGTRAQSLLNVYKNKQDLLDQASKYMTEHPGDTEAQDRFTQAIMMAQKDQPGALESAWRLGTSVAGIIPQLPTLVQQVAKFGVSSELAEHALMKRLTGQELDQRDDVALQTMFKVAQTLTNQGTEGFADIRNWLASHSPVPVSDQPNMMGWGQINHLPEDQQRVAINAKINSLVQRRQDEQAALTGELPGPYRGAFQAVTGLDPNTEAALAKNGIHRDPEAIQGGALVGQTMAFAALDPLIGAAGGGLMAKALETGGDIAKSPLAKAGLSALQQVTQPVAQKVLEDILPGAGEKVGKAAGYGVAKATVIAPLKAIGIPPWLSAQLPVGRVAGRIGGAIGRAVGEIPLWTAQKAQQYGEWVGAAAHDMATGENTLLANHGPWGQFFVNVPAGIARGAIMSMPFATGAQSPEEAAQVYGFGGLMGGLHEFPTAARNAGLSTLFFRDPDTYPTINAPHADYGTDYSGLVLDQAHNNFMANQSPVAQQAMDDMRANTRSRNVEIYQTDNAHFQGADAHLQNTINPATGQTYLPKGNLQHRAFNWVTDPGTGKTLILINGDMAGTGFGVAGHEIGHSIYRMLTPEQKQQWKNLFFQHNDPDAVTQRYTRNASGRGYNFTDLPTEAEINSGAKQYLPSLGGITQEHMLEEGGAETVARILQGQPLHTFTRSPTLFRQAQLGVGTLMNKLGFNLTPEEARTILGVKPSVAQMWMMEKALRDFVQANRGQPGGGGVGPKPSPAPRGGVTTAPPTGGAAAGIAPGPTPPPPGGPKKVVNNQPNIGGGSTGAPQSAIDDAVKALQAMGMGQREAKGWVNASSGQNADELAYNAFRLSKTKPPVAGEIGTPATPQQAAAPILPHPLAQHRLMRTGELARRATLGDEQARQALIERHGVDWLEQAEKEDPDVARMYRRQRPDDAAEQDVRIKAKEAVAAQAKAEGKPAPTGVVDANRIESLRRRAETEVSQKVKNREAAVHQRHLQTVMEEHAASLPPGDTRVRAQVDPDTGRTVYYGTHWDPNDPVHQWLLSRMDPQERRFMAEAQAAIANGVSMNFNYTHAKQIAPGEELPTGPERAKEYEEETAKERAAGIKKGQVGNRTALPLSVGVGADGQGLVYAMASDKVIANALKSNDAMGSKTPYGKIDRSTLPQVFEDMAKVSANHANGYTGDGSRALVGTAARPVKVNETYAPQRIPLEHAHFINMIMDARDPLLGPRVGAKGQLTAAGKAVEFAETNKGYTAPVLSRGQERTEVNPMRGELEKRGAFKGREMEHGYEQFRTDLMRERGDVAPALRKHGVAAEQIKAAPERRIAAGGFMPEEATPTLDPERMVKKRANDQLHWVNTQDLDNRWKSSPYNRDFYLSEGGGPNAIGDRYARAQAHLATDKPVNAPEVSIWDDGSAHFSDGRHTFAVMRDAGHEHVPVALDNESTQNARNTGLIGVPERRIAAGGFMPAEGYVSPNIEEGIKMESALGQLRTLPHRLALAFYQRVEDAFRRGARVQPTIGNWEGTSEGSTLTSDPVGTLDEMRFKNAFRGLHSGQLSTAAFELHPEGKDRLDDIDFPNADHAQVDKLITKHGFPGSTIYQSPEGILRAHLIDSEGAKRDNAFALAREAGARSPEFHSGIAAFDGGPTRPEAAKEYRRILGEGGIQTRPAEGRAGLGGYPAGREHPLQRLYEEAEDNYQRLAAEHGWEPGAKPRIAPGGYMPLIGEQAQKFPEEERAGRTFVSPLHGAKQAYIDDKDLTWVAPPKGSSEPSMLDHLRSENQPMRLGDIINHPDLFLNYPDMRNIQVEMRPEMRYEAAYNAKEYNLRTMSVEPETIMLKMKNKESLAHELQHAVQHRENWPPGSSPAIAFRELARDPAVRDELRKRYETTWPERPPEQFPDQGSYFNYLADRAEHFEEWEKARLYNAAIGKYEMHPGEVEARTAEQAWKRKAPFTPEDITEEMKTAQQLASKREIAAVRQDQMSLGPDRSLPGSRIAPGGFMPIAEGQEEGMPLPKKGKKVAAQKIVAPQELRDRMITPEEKAALAEMQDRAQVALDKYPENELSVAPEAAGERALPPGVKKNEEVGLHFSANNPTLDFYNPEHQEQIAHKLVHDVLRRIISHPDSVGWYKRTIRAAMEVVGTLNPMIRDNPLHNLAFRLALAVTSQGQKVHPNFESAYRAYLQWAKTGKFPIDASTYFGGGIKFKAMEENFAKLNRIFKDYGPENMEELLKTPMKIGDIEKKFKVSINEPKDHDAEVSMLLGAKIGSFFNNLSGLFHSLTADLWFSRTMNRMAGKMMGFTSGPFFNQTKKIVPYLTQLRDAIHNGWMENATPEEQQKMLQEADALEPYRNNQDALDRDTAMQLTPTMTDWASRQHELFAKSGKEQGKTYIDKRPINYLAKNIDENFHTLQDDPRNVSERAAFRSIMQNVIGKLKAEGIDVPAADAQAIAWYLEQDLFSMAKYGRPGEKSFDYLDGAYALQQKYEGKRPDKFGKVPEPEPPPAAPKAKRKAPGGAMPIGAPEPKGREGLPSAGLYAHPPVQQQPAGQLPPAMTQLAPPPQAEVSAPPRQPSKEWQRWFAQRAAGAAQQQPQPSQQPATEEGRVTQGYGLQPEMASRVERWANAVKQQLHLDVAITEGRRSIERSNQLAASGIQAVRGGTSYHNYGEAIDYGFRTPDGKIDLYNEPAYAAAERLAHQFGLTGISSESGHLQNAQYGSYKDIPKEYLVAAPHKEPALAQAPSTAGPDAETRRRTGSAAAAHIMHEEGPHDVQDGIPEIYGFRQGQDSEYPALARARAAGNEAEVKRIAAQGFVDRAVSAGSQHFSDPAIKAQVMSLAHMRGPGGARDILNAVGTGRLDNSGSVAQLDPQAIQAINSMNRAEFMRRVQIARETYDKVVHGQGYWERFGRGLTARYAREREFYNQLS